jgi:hypothetical protein
MLPEFLKSVLLVVVAFVLKFVLAAIGVELDEEVFVAIVAAIVSYLLALFGFEGIRAAFPNRFK